ADAKEKDSADKAAAAQAPAAAGAVPPVAETKVEAQFVTIGSLDLDDGYRMLVTASNEGASIKRAEMASPRYRDQDDGSGSLGELEPENSSNGIVVRAVGAGTPAASATPSAIAPGDLIVGVGNAPSEKTFNIDAYKAALRESKPGQSFTLQIKRG